jgi:hypothetical protein
MPAERKARLDELGFVWDQHAAKWEEGLQHLQAFVKEQGHCRVSRRHMCADGYRLGQWVAEQRLNQISMPLERKAQLDALGFVWDSFAAQWEEGFQHLQSFVKEHGHCMPPEGHVSEDGYRLGSWVRNQRGKQDNMAAERRSRLDALGFAWAAKTNRSMS